MSITRDKLIHLIGDDNVYQAVSLFCLVLVWGSTLIFYNSLAIFENPPYISMYPDYYISFHKLTPYDCQLEYQIFSVDHYSWVNNFHIECDKIKIGLFGLVNSAGFLFGSLTFFLIKKIFNLKILVLSSIIAYIFSCLSIPFYFTYQTVLISLFLCGLFGFYCNIGLLLLVEDTLSKKKRIAFFGITFLGVKCIAYIYIPLVFTYNLEIYKLYYFISGQLLIAFFFILLFFFNSPMDYNKPNQKEKLIKILKGIASINKRLDEFNNAINKEGAYIMNDTTDGGEYLLDSITNKERINGWSLCKDSRLRYQFIIICFLSLATRGMYRGISIYCKYINNSILLVLSYLYPSELVILVVITLLMSCNLSRKITFFILYGILALSFILNYFMEPHILLHLYIFNSIYRFCLIGLLIVLYAYSNDLYPETIRVIGLGINFAFAMIGEMSMSMIIEFIDEQLVNIGYIILSCLCFLLGVFLKKSEVNEKEEIKNEVETMDAPALPLEDSINYE